MTGTFSSRYKMCFCSLQNTLPTDFLFATVKCEFQTKYNKLLSRAKSGCTWNDDGADRMR